MRNQSSSLHLWLKCSLYIRFPSHWYLPIHIFLASRNQERKSNKEPNNMDNGKKIHYLHWSRYIQFERSNIKHIAIRWIAHLSKRLDTLIYTSTNIWVTIYTQNPCPVHVHTSLDHYAHHWQQMGESVSGLTSFPYQGAFAMPQDGCFHQQHQELKFKASWYFYTRRHEVSDMEI